VTGRAAVFHALAAGERTIVRRSGEHIRVWMRVGGQVWWLEAGTYLSRLQEVEKPEDLPLAIVDWTGEDRRAEELERARVLVEETLAVAAALSASTWIWLGPTMGIVQWSGLGVLRCGWREGEVSWLSRAPAPQKEIAEKLWLDRDALVVREPTEAERAALARKVAPPSEALAALRSGERVAIGGRSIVAAGGRWISLRLDEALRVDVGAVINPWALVLTDDKLLDRLLGRQEWVVQPILAGLGADLAVLADAFLLSREEIVQRYFRYLQQGGSLSGGPTTDQSWTVRWDGGGYSISSYAPGEDGRPVPVSRELSEAELREMLVRFHMFGLHLLDG
jgi:hypothetical protein